MNESHDRDIRELLKSSLPPAGDQELRRDLWPSMLKRIESGESRRIRFAALDWVMAGLVGASVFVFPGLIPSILYHL